MQEVDAIGWRAADYDRLLIESEAGGFTPIAFGTVIAAESEFESSQANHAGSGAKGLTQMMPSVLEALGWRPGTPAFDVCDGDFGKAPVSIQLEFAYRYFREWRKRFGLARWRTRAQMYLANFLPADLPHGADGSFVLAADQGRRPKVYAQNWRGLDRNRDGKILVAEVELFLVDAISRRARQPFAVFLEGVQRARARRGLIEVEYHNDHDDKGPQDVVDVRAIQTALAAHGFDPGPLDGIQGAKTTAAVKSFQHARGLVVDGLVGPFTWGALSRPVSTLAA